MLRVRQLVSDFGGPFDLDLARGECVAVLGASGTGKSVLLRLIADLDAGIGEVTLDGLDRDRCSGPQWRRRVVYQAAEPAWWAADAAAHFGPGDRAQVRTLLPMLGLSPDLLDVDIARLSTGERQRLALVRSLAVGPDVLLLDEPTASLDAASTAAVEALLRARMDRGLAVLLVTHSREQAARLAQRAFDMVDGALRPA
jgi:ABC-type iron transport system FetAB ATPase subunit